MTKKHFIRLAEYIKKCDPYCEPFTAKQIEYLAYFCHEANPHFNRERWINFIGGFCGPNGGTPLPPRS